jgi:hypothetical protein
VKYSVIYSIHKIKVDASPSAQSAQPEYELSRVITTGMSAPPIELVIWKPSVDEEKIPVPRHIAATCGSELATKPRRLAAESPPMERKDRKSVV